MVSHSSPEYNKEYRRKHKNRIKKYHLEYGERNREKLSQSRKQKYNSDLYRDTRYKYYYGISLEEYTEFLVRQGGVCAICRELEIKGNGQFLHIDHEKNTGKVRGLLCNGCNTALGSFMDDPVRIRQAAEYLEKWKKNS